MGQPDAPLVVAAFKQAVADPNSALRRNLPGIDTSKAASASQFCYNDGQVAIACPASPAPTSTDDTTRIAIGVVVILLILLGEQGASARGGLAGRADTGVGSSADWLRRAPHVGPAEEEAGGARACAALRGARAATATGGALSAMRTQATFNDIDQNHDGQVSRVRAHSPLGRAHDAARSAAG